MFDSSGSMIMRRIAMGTLLVATGCVSEASGSDERLGTSTSALGAQFYVDPDIGSDTTSAGTEALPWRTVKFAATELAKKPAATQAGAVLNVRGGKTYAASLFPNNLAGTAANPIIVQPWPAGPGADQPITFDASFGSQTDALRQTNNSPAKWAPVPASAGGVPGEWRTTEDLTTNGHGRIAFGQMLDSKYRLITYQELGDLRATNESFLQVPLSDPRPALGPILSRPTHKIPLTYLGPGIVFVPDQTDPVMGRIHVRLAHTHLGTPGIADYTGETDPNKVALAIAGDLDVPLAVESQHIVFRNVIAQNGGGTTLKIDEKANHVTFDHCQVYGGLIGVKVSSIAGAITFRDCLFDGGLAPWTTRGDVKEDYTYVSPDCPTGCGNFVGAKTSDILVSHSGDNSLYERCTFRRGHDGIQIKGQHIEVQSSLFEDLNDESIRFVSPVVDARVHENLVRQTAVPLSCHSCDGGGPLYVYRNVFDQRVPTRGSRVLPPDVDVPFVWRYGSDFKNPDDKPNAPPTVVPELYVYQNTFISSTPLDKAQFVTSLFKKPATLPRHYVNNIHLSLNLDLPISTLPPQSSKAKTAGNVWYRFQNPVTPLLIGNKQYFDFDTLHLPNERPDWEVASLYQDPQLANFTDEYFEYADGYPNTDYRPGTDVGGILLDGPLAPPLPPGAPNMSANRTIRHAGAFPAAAAALAVGVDAVTVLPDPNAPVARAGNARAIRDTNGDGFESVALDGTGSTDPNGNPLSYAWFIRGKLVSTQAAPSLLLPEGEHVVRLVVTDSTGKSDSDAVVVRIVPPFPGENRLGNPGFESSDLSDWTIGNKGIGLTSNPAAVHSGDRALAIVQRPTAQVVKQRVPVTSGATYVVSGWVKTQRGITSATPSTLVANVLTTSGATIPRTILQTTGSSSPYVYASATIVAPRGRSKHRGRLHRQCWVRGRTGHGRCPLGRPPRARPQPPDERQLRAKISRWRRSIGTGLVVRQRRSHRRRYEPLARRTPFARAPELCRPTSRPANVSLYRWTQLPGERVGPHRRCRHHHTVRGVSARRQRQPDRDHTSARR